MKKWTRMNYLPNKPLYGDRPHVTGSKEHLDWARYAAREGMVLLKNEKKLLPFTQKTKIATFGKGLFDYVKGGGGSGDVSVAYVHNLYDGLCLYKEKIALYEPLVDYYRDYVGKEYAKGALPGLMAEAELEEDLVRASRKECEVALVTISRFSGEGWDRKSVYYEGQEPSEERQSKASETIFGESDYYLTKKEEAMLKKVMASYDRIVLVLNIGGMMDSSWFVHEDKIQAVLLAWQGGMEGGYAMADLLVGQSSPSGKLPDTFARSLEDYPSTASFHESPEYVEYEEDIYVGYRYFATIPRKWKAVNYPFGYGLSYTVFEKKRIMAKVEDQKLWLLIQVTNVGDYRGKEVVAVYIEAPQGRLGKAKRSLVAFDKTRELKPSESQMVAISIPFADFASYDDLGQIQKSSWLLEKGDYGVYLGLEEEKCFSFTLEENVILDQVSEKCSPKRLGKRLMANGDRVLSDLSSELGDSDTVLSDLSSVSGDDDSVLSDLPPVLGDGRIPALRGRESMLPKEAQGDWIRLLDVHEGRYKLEEFIAQLSLEELADLLGGQPNTGIANTYGFGNLPKYGVPNAMTCDGPAGLRILPEYEIYTTAWPCATLLASSWDRELLYQMGRMAGEEVKENNLAVWLAPAVNIHRSPLCGRNFEYYSEDPYLTGELAAALIQGVQSLGIGATVKHLACNNKETNRRDSDSRLSERALREIYLRQFEIIIKKARPWVVMSSYNLINGVRASENKELLEDILRGEWGYKGLVCSDWYTHGEHYKEMLAGNDVKMGCGYPDRLLLALERGAITRADLEHAAKRVLELLLKLD